MLGQFFWFDAWLTFLCLICLFISLYVNIDFSLCFWLLDVDQSLAVISLILLLCSSVSRCLIFGLLYQFPEEGSFLFLLREYRYVQVFGSLNQPSSKRSFQQKAVLAGKKMIPHTSLMLALGATLFFYDVYLLADFSTANRYALQFPDACYLCGSISNQGMLILRFRCVAVEIVFCLTIGWFSINILWKPVLVKLKVGYLGLADGHEQYYMLAFTDLMKDDIWVVQFPREGSLGFYIVTGSISLTIRWWILHQASLEDSSSLNFDAWSTVLLNLLFSFVVIRLRGPISDVCIYGVYEGGMYPVIYLLAEPSHFLLMLFNFQMSHLWVVLSVFRGRPFFVQTVWQRDVGWFVIIHQQKAVFVRRQFLLDALLCFDSAYGEGSRESTVFFCHLSSSWNFPLPTVMLFKGRQLRAFTFLFLIDLDIVFALTHVTGVLSKLERKMRLLGLVVGLGPISDGDLPLAYCNSLQCLILTSFNMFSRKGGLVFYNVIEGMSDLRMASTCDRIYKTNFGSVKGESLRWGSLGLAVGHESIFDAGVDSVGAEGV
ncbi:hypothetical protein SASPL_104092 [Salvia splendens]|uniref:Uncharacterized protein n=1 Tax=Salvia splendens TaxID=180675 RepID=A0A8X8YM56_SALSN|nr:hypothetical protein SASPL_104092 [Salvia splendens]